MKSAAVAAFGLLAGLASASSPIRHLHFPRANSTITSVDDAAPTTLTVIATSVHTVISCAPTVTNCPARTNQTGFGSLPESAKTTVVVTDTIVLATTVCPVAQASSISSSLQAAHSSGLITGSTVKPTGPAVTPPANVAVSVTDVVTQKTLTMTIGKGTDASVVTTTIKATTRETITVTSTLGNVKPVQTAGGSSGSSTGGNPPPAGAAPGPASCEGAPTVTVTVARETVVIPASTVFVTVTPSACDSSSSSAVTGKANLGSGSGSGSGSSGSGSDSGSSGSDSGSSGSNSGSSGSDSGSSGSDSGSSGSDSGSSGSGSGSSGSEGSGSDNAATSVETPCPSDITTTVRTTVTVQPYPINNGTITSGAVRPTGFARLRR